MDSILVEMATQDMIDDHNKLVKQYHELLAKYDALLVMCVNKGVK